MRKQINGCYTRLLRITINISWKDKVTNTQLYRGLPNISEVIKQRRLRPAGHSIRLTDELAQLNCNGIQRTVYETWGDNLKFIDILKNDCDCEEDKLRTPRMDINCKIWLSENSTKVSYINIFKPLFSLKCYYQCVHSIYIYFFYLLLQYLLRIVCESHCTTL